MFILQTIDSVIRDASHCLHRKHRAAACYDVQSEAFVVDGCSLSKCRASVPCTPYMHKVMCLVCCLLLLLLTALPGLPVTVVCCVLHRELRQVRDDS
jgi:hypothetical protein